MPGLKYWNGTAFVDLKGDPGATGAAGTAGATGPAGPAGATGATGPQGVAGSRVPYATTSYTFDDFIGGTNGSGNIGQIGWNTAGGNVNTPAAEANHPGIIGRNSGATANTYAWTRLIFGCMASDLFDLIYLFRMDAGSAGTDTLVRLGLGTTGTANPDTDGVYLEKLAADVNWFFVTRVGGVQTRIDSTIAVTANVWIKVQMRRINGTQIGFRLATGAEVILTTNLPTISLLPFFAVMGTTTTARGLGVDFFDLQVAVTR